MQVSLYSKFAMGEEERGGIEKGLTLQPLKVTCI